MKCGKAYRIFMLVFCAGYAGIAVLLRLIDLLTFFWMDIGMVGYILRIPLGMASEGYAARIAPFVLPTVVALVSVFYFLHMGTLRTAIKKLELFVPVFFGIWGLLVFFVPQIGGIVFIHVTPIAYIVLCLAHWIGLDAEKRTKTDENIL